VAVSIRECKKCDSKCCRYFALEIDEPTGEEGLDDIRWFLCHQGASVFVEEGKWYLELQNVCKYLLPQGRCAMYEKRPKICAKYGENSEGEIDCHISGAPFDYEFEFESLEEFEDYIERVWKKSCGGKRRRPGKSKGKRLSHLP